MAFFESLEKLQSKPEHFRRRIVIVASVALTAIIFVVWFMTTDFNKIKNKGNGAVIVSEGTKNVSSPIASMKNIFSGFMENLNNPDAIVLPEN